MASSLSTLVALTALTVLPSLPATPSAAADSSVRLQSGELAVLCASCGVAALTKLQELSFRGSAQIGMPAAPALVACLRDLTALTRLDLSHCVFTACAQRELAPTVFSMPHLREFACMTTPNRGHTFAAAVPDALQRAARARGMMML